MKKQTAVEWLKDTLESFGNKHELLMSWNTLDELIEQAKEMEKEQIVDAYVECWKANMPDGYECKKSAEEYYNETYGGHN
jgi:HEPN domain-containing protein